MSDQDESTQPDYSSLLAGIVDENGRQKYQDTETALNALKAAQDHIRTLESENKQYKEQNTTLSTVADRFKDLEDKLNQTPSNQEDKAGVNPDNIKEEIKKILGEVSRETQLKQNRDAFVQSMSKKYGEKLDEVLETRAKELGLTKEDVFEQASKSPVAASALFKEVAPTIVEKSSGTINHEGSAPPPKRVSIMDIRDSKERMRIIEERMASYQGE